MVGLVLGKCKSQLIRSCYCFWRHPMRKGRVNLQDVASLRDFYEVNLELARPSAPLSFYEVDKAIVSKGEVLPPSIIHKCQLVDTLVGEGSVLRVRYINLSGSFP